MTRAAGSSNAYTWKLTGTRTVYELAFPSVTHILKSVKDAMGFGGMAWWGYKIGIEDLALQRKLVKNDPVKLLELYEDTKDDSTHTPNTIRDEAGDRGTEGHNILEKLALGTMYAYEDGSVVYLVDDGDDPEPWKPEAWDLAAARWWLNNEDSHVEGSFWPERSVWSVAYGYQGTLDLGREVGRTEDPDTWGNLEIIDYKSHKPAYGARKDGSYREGEGPAYIEDLMQLQAYANAVEELGLGTVVGTRVVLLGADGVAREDTRTVPFDLFLDMRSIHDRICKDKNCQLIARAYARRK